MSCKGGDSGGRHGGDAGGEGWGEPWGVGVSSPANHDGPLDVICRAELLRISSFAQ